MDPIVELLASYSELNCPRITELKVEPSALEFMRYVALNIPFVIRGAASEWKATKLWNIEYLREALKAHIINVAVTPNGNADSPQASDDGSLKFVKPLEENQPFGEFIDYISNQELNGIQCGDVRYAQTQNDNLRGEYSLLFGDVERNISWARIALQKMPEAINIWVGNSRSITALHKDNYENIYCQIIGAKHFVLLPPLSYPCVREQSLHPATYIREEGILKVVDDENGKPVPFPTWDPDVPNERLTKYSNLARPMRVTLEAGDMLYLPALWYHKVSQSCSQEGICCAINYWYDMVSYSGAFLPYTEFVRGVCGNP